MRIPFLKPKPAAPPERALPSAEPGAVQAARTQARRRLAGALMLLVAGVVAFPVLFETQPRPMAVDTPILMPPRDLAPAVRGGPVPLPVTTLPADGGDEASARSGSAPGVALPTTTTKTADVAVVEPPPVIASAVTPAAVSVASAARTAPAALAPAPAAPAAPAVTVAPEPGAVPPSDDGTRARALLENQPAAVDAKAPVARFVVQAGAYGEATALREARQKVEKLGFKTYTQVIENDAGTRTRVRVGPFATRQEAEAVAAKVKAAGLQANILAL